MSQNVTVCVGDVCTYAYLDKNKSLSIVEVVSELSEEVVVVKFHQVISDDSGNGFFTYMCNTGGTMNVSRKYLNKIDLVGCQKAEIKSLNKEVDRLSQCVLYHDGIVSDLEKDVFNAKAEAIKEFAELVYKTFVTEQNWRDLKQAWLYDGECELLENMLNNLAKEAVKEE